MLETLSDGHYVKMPGIPLSPEICSRIVRLASSTARRGDLTALCLTCKAFQREAEVRLYDALAFSDPQRAHLACQTIIQNDRLGLLVHSFWFTQESRRPPPLGRAFWITIKGALNRMHNLEYLVLYDGTFSNSWIFDPAEIKFQLRETKLRFTWDASLVKFMEGQRKLHALQTCDHMDDSNRLPLSPGTLPLLRIFDGTLMVGMQMLLCPLTHLQMSVDTEVLPQLLILLPRLSNLHKTLRGFSLTDIPEDLACKVLQIISSVCPKIHHVGFLPFPPINVSPSLPFLNMSSYLFNS